MNRDWLKYINKNLYSECQLITALNAYYYLTGKCIRQKSKRYEKLVDLVGARYGSAINIEKVWNKLGLRVIKEGNSLFDFKPTDLPLEYSIWHKKYGFHSTLIVNYNIEVDAVQITNFDKVTNWLGWMFKEDMYMYAEQCGDKPIYRLFGLK